MILLAIIRIYKFTLCKLDLSNTVINKNPVKMYYLSVYVRFTLLISNETLINKGFQNACKQRDVRILKLLNKYKRKQDELF
jgi:hypothetical protein